MTVNILGTPYEIIVKKYDEEETFARQGVSGFCDVYAKEIVVCDMSTHAGWEYETVQTSTLAWKSTVRHEIVHAFLYESGLRENSTVFDDGWAMNEELVDWIAIQGPKIYRAWVEADAV